jgi:hypothetical protein
MKKLTIETSGIREEFLTQLKNTNKSLQNSIKPRKMQNKNTVKFQLIIRKTKKRKCSSTLSLKEIIIQSLKEYLLEEGITGRNKFLLSLKYSSSNGLLSADK